MFEKPCRCGLSKKNFFKDIGPYFVNECCEKVEVVGSVSAEATGMTENEIVSAVENFAKPDKPLLYQVYNVAELAKLPLSKSKLKDMPISALKGIARERALPQAEELNKKDLIELLRSRI